MKQNKAHYQAMTNVNGSGYSWGGFWDRKHHFIKGDYKTGFLHIKANEQDLENGNIDFMTANNLSNEN